MPWKSVLPLILITGAGMVSTAILIGLIYIVWLGGWSPAVEAARLNILGTISTGCLIMIGGTMIGLLLAGPVSKIQAKIGDNEISLDQDD